MKLLWLFIPDWEQNGMLATIKSIPKVKRGKMSIDGKQVEDDDEPFWTQTDACAGFRVGEDCHLRDAEMELVAYQPFECQQAHENSDISAKC